MKISKTTLVVCGEYSRSGYQVQVIRGDRMLYSYRPGNHNQDSVAVAAPGDPAAEDLRTIRARCVRECRWQVAALIEEGHKTVLGEIERKEQDD